MKQVVAVVLINLLVTAPTWADQEQPEAINWQKVTQLKAERRSSSRSREARPRTSAALGGRFNPGRSSHGPEAAGRVEDALVPGRPSVA